MLHQLIRQFHFTRAERHGALALLLLSGLCFSAPALYRKMYRSAPENILAFAEQLEALKKHKQTDTAIARPSLFPFDPNTASVEIFLQLGLQEKVARTIVKYRDRGGSFRTAADLQKIYTLPAADFQRLKPYIRIGMAERKTVTVQQKTSDIPPELFAFDPNTATEAELLRLGLPRALVSRLLRYREKGGRFFEKSDFRKLYGLEESDFKRLEPFITLAPAQPEIRQTTYAGGSAKTLRPQPLDINSAPAETWQQLPGIGSVRAQQIVRYREKLGGFISTTQVAETRGLPDSVFQKILPQLVLNSPVFRKLNLNSASAADFNAHPYFSFRQAQLIIRYREQNGPFSRISDLEKIAAFTDQAWLERVKAYVAVE